MILLGLTKCIRLRARPIVLVVTPGRDHACGTHYEHNANQAQDYQWDHEYR